MKMPVPNIKRIPILESSLKLKPINPVIHPVITKFEELPEDQKDFLRKIKQVVVENIGECTLTLFGSRVNGNWTEDSDYDIFIHKIVSLSYQDVLRKHDFGKKVDLFFSDRSPHEKSITF